MSFTSDLSAIQTDADKLNEKLSKKAVSPMKDFNKENILKGISAIISQYQNATSKEDKNILFGRLYIACAAAALTVAMMTTKSNNTFTLSNLKPHKTYDMVSRLGVLLDKEKFSWLSRAGMPDNSSELIHLVTQAKKIASIQDYIKLPRQDAEKMTVELAKTLSKLGPRQGN